MESERRQTIQMASASHALPPKRSVLVVDDEVMLARSVSRVLERAGCEVITAHDGATAIRLVTERAFDVILSDIHMPGMTGLELLTVVRAYDLDVPVILMTGAPALETAIDAVSLGALQYLPKPTPNDTLLKAVERASRLHRMARVKRDALELQGDGHEGAGDRAGLQARLNNALETMTMVFQPIVHAEQRTVFGYEALMRNAEPSLPHPGAVVGAAERLDRLPDVGRRVRRLAAEAFERAPQGTLLFVNLHTRDLLDPELYQANTPLMRIANRVVLEITERSTIDDVKDIQARVSVLRYHGFKLAIDDLGAGYAGLTSFVALEPEIVKLDMSIVRNVHDSAIRQRLVGSMATLCKEMGMQVVAEGVEVEEEAACVQALGCELVQGYLIARPGPPFPEVLPTARRPAGRLPTDGGAEGAGVA